MFSVSNVRYRLADDAQDYEYRMVVKTSGGTQMQKLADHLRAGNGLVEFRLSPAGD